MEADTSSVGAPKSPIKTDYFALSDDINLK
jgi:hypothetical protein